MNAIAFLPAPQTEATETEAEAPAFVSRSATVPRVSLVAAITTAASIVARRNEIPILGNALIRESGDGLEIVATDLGYTFRTVVPGEVETGFAVTLPAHGLRDLLKRSKAGDVTLTETEPGFVQITMGGASARLQTLPPDDFPALPSFKKPPAAEIEADPDAAPAPETEPAPAPVVVNFPIAAGELARALAYVAPAISTEETRYYLNGIFVHFRAHDVLGLRGLCFTATDGHRLHMRSIAALVPTNLPPVIVPRMALHHLAKYLGKKATGNVRVTVNHKLIRFTLPDGSELFSKLIDGTFPDYERILPRNNVHRVAIDSDAMADTVKQVSSVSAQKRPAVRFTVGAAGVTCEVNEPDAGTSTATVAASVSEGCEMVVGFNAGYVQDICANIDGETVWHLTDSRSPALITSPSDPRGLMVLMPTRV